MTPWLLIDYGEVISRPPPADLRAHQARRIGLSDAEFDARYWQHRQDFDAGMAAGEYWTSVAGRTLADDEVAALIEIDREGWAGLDPEMLALLAELREDGVRLALLSNAPHWQADAFEGLAWLEPFEHVFVSARLGLVKPDPAIFEHVLGELDAAPADVTFVDDKQANVDAAASVGLRAIRYTGVADDLRQALI